MDHSVAGDNRAPTGKFRLSERQTSGARIKVPFFDASAVNAALDVKGCVERVARSHHYILGREVAGFEGAFADYVGTKHCTAVGNGTDALTLALRSVGAGPGSRVMQVANAGFYGSTATYANGAIPCYVDVVSNTHLIDIGALQKALEEFRDVAAVVVTHLYGNMIDMEAVMSLARAHGVAVVEDCAQAHGAEIKGKKAGSFGDVGCFSFYPTKNLGALGDAGAVTTNDAKLHEMHRSLRQYGWSQKYLVAHQGGINSRMDEVQAAFLREKLALLDRHNEQRAAIKAQYNDGFKHLPVELPMRRGISSNHLYVLQTNQRDALVAHLEHCSIATAVHYPVPDHRQPAYAGADTAPLPVTEGLCQRVLSLPCYPGMPDDHVRAVVAAVTSFFATEGVPRPC